MWDVGQISHDEVLSLYFTCTGGWENQDLELCNFYLEQEGAYVFPTKAHKMMTPPLPPAPPRSGKGSREE